MAGSGAGKASSSPKKRRKNKSKKKKGKGEPNISWKLIMDGTTSPKSLGNRYFPSLRAEPLGDRVQLCDEQYYREGAVD